jgi:predicted regulator of amino acid metabolism with ACT domain
LSAAVAQILSRQGIVVRQALVVDPDALQDAKKTLVVGGQLNGKAVGKPGELAVAKSRRF